MKYTKLLWIVIILQFGTFILSGCVDDDTQPISPDNGGDMQENTVSGSNGEDNSTDVVEGFKENARIMETDLGKVSVDEDSNSGELIKPEDVKMVKHEADVTAEAPADLPTIEGAVDFNWAGVEDNGMLSYKMSGTDFKDVCGKQASRLLESGWSRDEGVAAEVNGTSTLTLNKSGYTLSLTCTGDVKNEDMVVVTMVKGQVL